MKYCLSNRQENKYLEQADAIRIEYRDINSIFDLIDDYPDKEILIYLPFNTEIDYNLLMGAAGKANITVGCVTQEQIDECIKNNIPFFFNWRVSAMIDVNRLKNLGAKYILLDAPLFFDLPKVTKILGNDGPKIIAVPNRANCGLLSSFNCIHGIWILPQSISAYEPYISMIVFDAEAEQERAYFRIYAKQQNWHGKTSDLIKDLAEDATCNAVLPEALEHRIYCAHRCEEVGACHICENAFKIVKMMEKKDE